MDGKSIYELSLRPRRSALPRVCPPSGRCCWATCKAGAAALPLNRTVIGGSACPPAMITAFNDVYGVKCCTPGA